MNYLDMNDSVFEGLSVPRERSGMLDLEAPIDGNEAASVAPSQGMSFSSWCQREVGGIIEEKTLQRNESFPMNLSKLKKGGSNEATGMSEEDEQSDALEETGKGRSSPWRRMKWTDSVIRLLIAVVARVGDDGVFDSIGSKRKSRVLQKKGKWKTVSKIMNTKGCHVSPQQCEDKFNDLNKKYKKLNDVLGRGNTCKVVEKPETLNAMQHLSTKEKDIVRKILCSKQLFYKEMCAYHNGQAVPNCPEVILQEGNASESESDGSDDEDSVESQERKGSLPSIEDELSHVFRNPNLSDVEKKQWIERRKLDLLDESVTVYAEALEIEKQRFKWLRYRNKKNDEFERSKLANERRNLEYEQAMLLLKTKLSELQSQDDVARLR